MTGAASRFLAGLPGVRAGEPLARHTTCRIGGPAEAYLEVAGTGRLAEVAQGCARHGIPLTLLGNGSNLLVADAGVAGLVVRSTDTAVRVEGRLLKAHAGARMARIAQAAQAEGLTGMEWALGIPGTVGGSVHNNAGCFGSEIAAGLVEVVGLTPAGEPAHWLPEACELAYRTSAFRHGRLQGALITGATFRLQRASPAAVAARMEEIGRERARTQPVSGRSSGSVFKNPLGDFAARLIDAAGLKGRRVGGAMVSLEHANFIVNAGGATAADVVALVRLVREAVLAANGLTLECEIEAVGRWPEGDPLAPSTAESASPAPPLGGATTARGVA